jgi:formylglycine-generating enzyme required for sulfatase activity
MFRRLFPKTCSARTVVALAALVARPSCVGAEEPPRSQPKSLKAPFSRTEAQAAQKAWANYLGKKIEEEIDLGDGLKMTFVLIPPGTFRMGSPEEDSKLEEGVDLADESELPRHRVTISKPFYLAKYAVTQAEYVRVSGKPNPSCFCADGKGKARIAGMDTSRFPVDTVSWTESNEFCTTLEKKLGPGWSMARLPSEAMREYSCRAGSETRWYPGDSISMNDAYFNQQGQGKLNRTREVGFGKTNSFGLFDMHGNVWEWCSDWQRVYTNEDQTDPEGPESGRYRIYRGGAWLIPAGGCRSAYRGKLDPSFKNNDLGFRVALVPTLSAN